MMHIQCQMLNMWRAKPDWTLRHTVTDVNFSACKTGLRPRRRACLGLGLDRLASSFDGLASPFARSTPAKKTNGLAHIPRVPQTLYRKMKGKITVY
jgi:hypothetical protein